MSVTDAMFCVQTIDQALFSQFLDYCESGTVRDVIGHWHIPLGIRTLSISYEESQVKTVSWLIDATE